MRQVAALDPLVADRIGRVARPLSGVELRMPGGRLRYDGFPVVTVSRGAVLAVLTEEARAVGARIHHGCDARADELDADLVVLADGARSVHRTARAAAFGTTVSTGVARYIWLGTAAELGDAATMFFVPTEHGPMAAHAYSCGGGLSTVVVELDNGTWRRAGFDVPQRADGTPGEIGDAELALLNEVFAGHVGATLVSNRSRWSRFDVVTNRRWSEGNRVLIGDAAHTAHFTVASGTTMALADAMALADELRKRDTLTAAFDAYERERRPAVARVQRLAGPSMRWWETYGRRMHLAPAQFGMHFITRTTAVSYPSLRQRCPLRVAEAEAAYRQAAGVAPDAPARHAVAEPFTARGSRLPHRLVGVGAPASDPPGSDAVVPRLVPGAWLEPLPDGAGRAGSGWVAGVQGQLLAPGLHALQFVALTAPDPAGEDDALREVVALRRRGIDGVLLLPGPAGWWDRLVEFGGRVRTEVGLVVAGCVPMDWSTGRCRDPAVDAWSARLHLALISARLDLVAQWPRRAADLAPPGRPDDAG
ncbi:FAD-dependent monooxygenase [Micromonospora sp. 15K316]|uniref:FAD-dependent monooxygenase n=1 Tax=Micromonospora sp. 15K316 TaxID=2530376 RepID=UPI0014045448|nr:FAD-dependent monooxygenase [Micromonospora sp. 15K316]